MLKVMSLMKRRPDLSFDEFRRWAQSEHPVLAQKLPGLRGYRMNVAREENPDNPYDAVSEMWFDSPEARLAAMPPIPEEEYFLLSTRLEVIETVHEMLRDQMRGEGREAITFEPEDYE